jgi:hypothetical protein
MNLANLALARCANYDHKLRSKPYDRKTFILQAASGLWFGPNLTLLKYFQKSFWLLFGRNDMDEANDHNYCFTCNVFKPQY